MRTNDMENDCTMHVLRTYSIHCLQESLPASFSSWTPNTLHFMLQNLTSSADLSFSLLFDTSLFLLPFLLPQGASLPLNLPSLHSSSSLPLWILPLGVLKDLRTLLFSTQADTSLSPALIILYWFYFVAKRRKLKCQLHLCTSPKKKG